MQYRSDIDGLRAVAVVSIVVFHLGLGWLPAGLFGVDIFFVISGYLITRIIAGEMERGGFSILDFYRRRVVRILPALLVMIALVCAAGCMLILPSELRALGRSAAAASAFASNFYFWRHADYFGSPDIQPLLHTWSLGVEEQFYLLYPLVLLALWRWLPGRLRLALGTIALGSLALGWWMPIDHPAGAFYLLPARGWELALGGLVALGCYPALTSLRARQWLCGGALAVLAGSLAVRLPLGIPAPAAIPATLATAVLIAYGAEGATARLLSLVPMRWLGRISYSLYLWHWPLISFYKVEHDGIGVVDGALLVAAMLAAALLSYALVERPVRERYRKRGRSGVVVAVGVAASLAVAAAASALAASAAYLRPLPPEAARVEAYVDYQDGPVFADQFGPVACHSGTMPYEVARCLKFDPARRNIVVLGDSHAAHLWRALAERFPGANVLEAASTNCLPLIGGGGGGYCRAMFKRVMREIGQPGQVQAVVLSEAWNEASLPLIGPTIRAIRARRVSVAVIGPGVRYRDSLPALLARAIWRGDTSRVDDSRDGEVPLLDQRVRAIALAEGASYYSLYDQECPAAKCRLLTGSGAPYHFDDSHLTLDAARELVKAMPQP